MEAPPYNGRLRAFADAIDVDHSHLIKVLKGDRAFSPKVVGRAARLLPEAKAQVLIKSYLQEIASEIAKNDGREAVVIR
jgi:hypothetical protein